MAVPPIYSNHRDKTRVHSFPTGFPLPRADAPTTIHNDLLVLLFGKPMRSRRLLAYLLAASAALSGCGFTVRTTYPNSIIGADGRPLVLDDVRKIVGDLDLSDDQKRQALRDLGLEDEELITALLGL